MKGLRLLIMAATLLAAATTWKLFESPILSLKDKLSGAEAVTPTLRVTA